MTVEFRIARPEDAPGILAIYAPYCESTHISFETLAPSEVQMRERIAQVLQRYPWIVAEAEGELVGYVYASQHRERAAYRWAVDVAAYVAPAYRRRGLAAALYDCLFAILRTQGYVRAYAAIALPNDASVGLHEAVGFRLAASFPRVGYKLGRWVDVGWWQYDVQPELAEPAEPRPFPAVVQSKSVTTALTDTCRRL